MVDKCIKVLLIEDNPGDMRLIQEMLSEASDATFDLECIDRLSAGLERISEGGFDTVLLDLGLPDSVGLDTFKSLHDRAPEVPIVMLTGLDDVTLAIEALNDGAQDYLVKSHVDSNSLVRSIYYAIERKKAEKHIKHLNSVLKAIWNVDKLIATEKERGSLLQNVCDALTEVPGYDAVWLGLLSDGGIFTMLKGSGFREDISRFRGDILGGNHPICIKNALDRSDLLLVVDRSMECSDCSFKNAYTGKEVAVIHIKHAGRLFGLIAVSLATDVTADEEEKGLLKAVASDIALTLYTREVEGMQSETQKMLLQKSMQRKRSCGPSCQRASRRAFLRYIR